jgi:Phage derived protein Gp49-like (DUF891)
MRIPPGKLSTRVRNIAKWMPVETTHVQGVHYRILYFFHGNTAAVVSHGLVKESAVPSKEIERAMDRKARFESNPVKHIYAKEQR